MLIAVAIAFIAAAAIAIYQLLTRLPRLPGAVCALAVVGVTAFPVLAWLPIKGEASTPVDFRNTSYGTSDSCRHCHQQHYDTWHDTWHRTMTQDVSDEAVMGDFDGEWMTVDGYPARAFTEGGHYFISVINREWEQAVIAAGQDPRAIASSAKMTTYSVYRLIGSHHQQVYLTKFPDGSYQTIPLVWLERQKRWITRAASFLFPDTGSFYDNVKLWNNGCVFCHNTKGQPGMQKTSDPSVYTWDSHVEEMGISCEACHGAGEEHIKRNQNPVRRFWLSETESIDPSIVNPARVSKEKSVLACARCHGKFIAKEEFGQACLVEGELFSPGDWEATEFYDIPNLDVDDADFEETDHGMYFWKDGTPRTTAMEYQGVIMSPCYLKGEMTCVSCHGMHGTDPNDQLLYGDDPKQAVSEKNQACVQCHEHFKDEKVLGAHTHHDTQSAGSLCYNCHMPFQAYSLLKRVRSHRISSPDVANSASTGIPHACNTCHVDKSLAWTDQFMKEWYDHPAAELTDTQKTMSTVVEHALSGHALQRALAVEQLGAAETFDSTDKEWRPEILIHNLSDPYAAVRLIAFESLQKLPGFADFEYDYIGTKAVRQRQILEAKDRVKQIRNDDLVRRLRAVLGGNENTSSQSMIDALKAKRDDVRLFIAE